MLLAEDTCDNGAVKGAETAGITGGGQCMKRSFYAELQRPHVSRALTLQEGLGHQVP